MTRPTRHLSLFAICFTLLHALPTHADDQPRWEIGIGAAALRMPDYRGSDEHRDYLWPIPWFVYRLDWLKADRNGVQARLIDRNHIDLGFSLSATPPVRSRHNQARQGMPDVPALLEFGPAMNVDLWQDDTKRRKLTLRMPLRAGLTIESSPRYAGWVFSPRINLDLPAPAPLEGWKFGTHAGVIFTDRKQNALYYDVTPAQALANRPAYQADGGYAGSQLTLSLSRQFPRMWAGFFVRTDYLDGASFEDSPLMRRKTNVSAGFAIAWRLGQSSEMVRSLED